MPIITDLIKHVDSLMDLLAIIHRDGGQHTKEVGITQSVIDAKKIISEYKYDTR